MAQYDTGVGQMVFDFETSVDPNAVGLLDKVKAPKNYKDADAIAKYEQKGLEERLADAATDIDLARIVAVAWKEPGMPAPLGYIATNEDEERKLLTRFIKRIRSDVGGNKVLIGFNVLDFDIPLLLRRCLYLGIPAPSINVDRFRHYRVIDVMQELSFNGKLRYKSADFYTRRFGLDKQFPDEFKGADIPALVVAKRYMDVLAHCKVDVNREYALAEKLGFIEEPRPALSLADQPF